MLNILEVSLGGNTSPVTLFTSIFMSLPRCFVVMGLDPFMFTEKEDWRLEVYSYSHIGPYSLFWEVPFVEQSLGSV